MVFTCQLRSPRTYEECLVASPPAAPRRASREDRDRVRGPPPLGLFGGGGERGVAEVAEAVPGGGPGRGEAKGVEGVDLAVENRAGDVRAGLVRVVAEPGPNEGETCPTLEAPLSVGSESTRLFLSDERSHLSERP